MLVLLIFKGMFKSRNTLLELNFKEKDHSDSVHSLNLDIDQNASYGEEMPEKDFFVFTIYEPDLISTHVTISAVGENDQI